MTIDPLYIAIDLTYLCPLNCSFCFIKKSYKKSDKNELNLNNLKILIKGLQGRKRHFYITGGEPLLKKWLPDLVYFIKREGHTCHITTNGLLLSGITAKRLIQSAPDEISVSLHGFQKIHDTVSGRQGTFSKVLKNLQNFISAPNRKTSIEIWCTINHANFRNLYNFYLFLKKIRPERIVFNHLEFTSKKDFIKTQAIFSKELKTTLKIEHSETRLFGLDPDILSDQICKIKEDLNANVRFYPDLNTCQIHKWYNPKISFHRKGLCHGQFNSMWISSNLRILTCQPLAHDIGKLYLKNPQYSVNSPAYSLFRKSLLRHGGFFPVCSRCGREPYTNGAKI